MHKTRRKHKHKIEHETSNKLDLIELRLFKEAMKLERKRKADYIR
jgi:hypothetical protein